LSSLLKEEACAKRFSSSSQFLAYVFQQHAQKLAR
jgi:hypothetical protein